MTMEIYRVDGRQIYAGRSWVAADGTQHPKTWVRWSDEEKKAAGISTVVLQPFPDDRLYASSHNGDGSVASSARALDGEHGVKAALVAQVKQQQGALLAETDWQIIRKADNSTAIDAKVNSWRTAIRNKGDSSETAITDAADTAALAVLLDAGSLFDWPELDD
jgi:hypothetical protein